MISRKKMSGRKSLTFNTLVKISNFTATHTLREINFGWFQKVKNCHLNKFGGFEFWFLGISHLKMSKFPKNSNFRAAELVKLVVYEAPKWPNWFHIKNEWRKNPEISTLWVSKFSLKILNFWQIFREIIISSFIHWFHGN